MINVVIFASREKDIALKSVISHTVNTLKNIGLNYTVDIIVNGNATLAKSLKSFVDDFSFVELFAIPVADKGNAWNQHIHKIWREDAPALYIDGYVLIDESSVVNMLKKLSGAEVLGTSGVPSNGFSARFLKRKMRSAGGFHGNCCMLSSTALQALKLNKIFLPLGMYRVDGLMGAFLCYGLAPKQNHWAPETYIPVTFDATWSVYSDSILTYHKIYGWWLRKFRQAKGDFENQALKYYMRFLNVDLDKLPKNMEEIMLGWKIANAEEYLQLTRRSFFHRKSALEIERSFQQSRLDKSDFDIFRL